MTLGRAMAQAVSCQFLIAEDRVRSLISPFLICGGQSGTGTGSSSSSSDFPVNITPDWLSILIHHLVDEQ
jgi:hypothetical protein